MSGSNSTSSLPFPGPHPSADRAMRRAPTPLAGERGDDAGSGEPGSGMRPRESVDLFNARGHDSTVDTDGKGFDARYREPWAMGTVWSDASSGRNIPDVCGHIAGGDSRRHGNKPAIAAREGFVARVGEFIAPEERPRKNRQTHSAFTTSRETRPERAFFIERAPSGESGETSKAKIDYHDLPVFDF
jgi:hypothetical protein